MLLKYNQDLWRVKRRLQNEFARGDIVSFYYCGIKTRGQLISKNGNKWKILLLPVTFKLYCYEREKRLTHADRN